MKCLNKNEMSKHIIGSTFIKEQFPDFRNPNDIDYLIESASSSDKSKNNDWHVIPPMWDYLQENELTVNVIFTLKCSHMFWDIKWEKHLADLLFLKNKDATLIPELFWDLYDFWTDVHGPRRTPDFSKSNEDFFDDNVDRQFEHDQIHEIIAYYDRPLFEKIKEDQSIADVSEELFYKQSILIRKQLINEEIYALSMERYFLNGKKIPELVAYRRILKKMILNLTPIWMAVWILDNIILFQRPDIKIKQTFKTNLKTWNDKKELIY